MAHFKNRTVSRLAERAKAFFTSRKGLASRMPWRQRALLRSNGANKKVITPKWKLAQTDDDAHPSPGESTPVFFVVGYQKSGTTWLMTMLDSHPEILCRGEGRPFGQDWRQEHLKERRTSYPPTSLYNAILSAEDLRYWVERSVWTKDDDTDEQLANLTGLAIEYFLAQRLSGTKKRLVGDKTVLLGPKIVKEIGAICPEAKVIHIIRDGRDVVVSSMHHRWNQAEDLGGSSKTTPDQIAKREAYRKNPGKLLETDEGMFPEKFIEKNAMRWNTRVSNAVKDGPILLGANYAEVRYEDLLENPEEELGRLLEFLGADAGEQIVRQCASAASFERLSGGRERGQEAASFFRKGVAGDWKTIFTEQNKRDFKAAAGDLLIKLGYEMDHRW